jgi:hypothetical protein
MGIALAAALVAFTASHAALLVGLARRRRWRTAVAATVLWPLAPWSGWRCGMRARALAWVAALVFYAAGAALRAPLEPAAIGSSAPS